MRHAIRYLSATILLLAATADLQAQGWVVSPSREELVVRPGETKTIVVRVERDAAPGEQAVPVRFTATPGDWDISRQGEVMLLPSESTPESANGWINFTPASFTLNPGAVASVRVSVTVPKETAAGLYRGGLFFEEHSVVPPAAAGAKRMVLRYRLSSLLYVQVPTLTRQFEIRSVEVKGDAEKGWLVFAVLENKGTQHLRPQHWVEVKDAAGAVVFKTEPKPTMPLLPAHQLEVALAFPKGFSPSPGLQVRYLVDAGKDLPLQATTLTLAGND